MVDKEKFKTLNAKFERQGKKISNEKPKRVRGELKKVQNEKISSASFNITCMTRKSTNSVTNVIRK